MTSYLGLANPAPKAALSHESFIHHGYGILVVLDAAGVWWIPLCWSSTWRPKRAGTPGHWTLDLVLASARGRADITLTPAP